MNPHVWQQRAIDLRCPTCGLRLRRAMTPEAADPALQPKPGDLTLCARCHTFAVITDAHTLRPLVEADLDRMSPGRRAFVRDYLAARQAERTGGVQ